MSRRVAAILAIGVVVATPSLAAQRRYAVARDAGGLPLHPQLAVLSW